MAKNEETLPEEDDLMDEDDLDSYGDEDENEDDYEEYVTVFYCDLVEDGKPCANHGQCVAFDILSMTMNVCPYLIVEDRDTFEANN